MRILLGCLVALALCGLAVGLTWGRGGDVVAEVEGLSVTVLELQEALRKHLWVRGESWSALGTEARGQVRLAVLETLIDDRLIRACRLKEGAADSEAEVRRESAMLKRQFTDMAEYERRLASQQHTQKSLDQAIRDAQLDEAWIATRIPPRPVDDARAWYGQHKERLRMPQAHHAAHIFLTRHDAAKPDREAEIRSIHRQLIAKEKTFATLAREHSEDVRTKTLGGDLGWFTRLRMPADFVSAVEKLRVGEVSQPVSTVLGWHVIRVYERRPSRLPSFEETGREIASLLASERSEAQLKMLLADLRRRSSSRIVYHQAVIGRTGPAQWEARGASH